MPNTIMDLPVFEDTRGEFQALLPYLHTWLPMAAGIYCTWIDQHDRPRLPVSYLSRLVPFEILAALHMDLPLAVQSMAGSPTQKSPPCALRGDQLACQLKHFQQPWLVPSLRHTHYLFSLKQANVLTTEEDSVVLEGVVYQVQPTPVTTDAGVRTIDVVTSVRANSAVLSLDWLEQRYPGWSTRLDTWRSLANDTTGMADFLFTAPAPPQETLVLPDTCMPL